MQPSHCSKTLTIHAHTGAYKIVFLENLGDLLSLASQFSLLIVDAFFKESAEFRLLFVNQPVFFFESFENNKTLKGLEALFSLFNERRITPSNSRILVIGGGTLHDVTGLACSLYKRGIPFTYVPTTLLAAVDVCIGGKTAINFEGAKNVLGHIYPPQTVYIVEDFFKTLAQEHFVGGIIEALKTCFVKGSDSFLRIKKALEASPLLIRTIISQSLQSKKYFVEKDENDKGIRRYLNFGHTFGHVIESISNFKIHHGVAVGFGMLWEIELCHLLNNQESSLSAQVQTLKDILLKLLRSVPEAGSQFCAIDMRLSLPFFLNDKKNRDQNSITFILPISGKKNMRVHHSVCQVSLPFNEKTKSLITMSWEGLALKFYP